VSQYGVSKFAEVNFMPKQPLSSVLKRVATLLLCAILTAQSALGLELGGMTLRMTRTSAPSGRMIMSRAFMSRVGGVAFAGKAEGIDGVKAIGLRYDPTAEDGSRLHVKLLNKDGKTSEVVASIFDWELVPIARFAESDSDICMTLFGEAEKGSEDVVRKAKEEGAFAVGYHKDLSDTLLGLRLLQADMLVMEYRDAACELFTEDGKYVLGRGETAPDVKLNGTRFDAVQKWLYAQDDLFESYVVCDHKRKVTFSAHEGSLVLSGTPIWYCWRHSERFNDTSFELMLAENRERSKEIQQRRSKLSFDARLVLRTREFNETSQDEVELYESELAELIEEKVFDYAKVRRVTLMHSASLEEAEQSFVDDIVDLILEEESDELKSDVIDSESEDELLSASERENTGLVLRVVNRIQKLKKSHPAYKEIVNFEAATRALEKASVERLKSKAEAIPDEGSVDVLADLSSGLTTTVEQQRGVNPAVYAALVKTMRYSALFRHIKSSDAAAYKSFVKQLSDVSAAPLTPANYEVKTPTIIE